jgi:iron complex transport system substrate-binding protein
MKSTTAFLIFCSCFLAAFAGCRRTGPAPVRSSTAPRLVSLAPNLTEMIWAVGAGTQLVGRTSACDQPPEVSSVPIVGGYGDPSIEMLISIQPDLVLFIDMLDKDFPARLKERGLEARHIPCLHLDDIPDALSEIGTLAGRPGQGEAAAAALRSDMAAARAAVSNAPRPSVLVVLWTDPIYTVGKGSFVSELVELAGGRNMGDSVESPYFQAAPEWIIEKNPDVILCLFEGKPDEAVARIKGIPAFATLAAIRRNQVYAGFALDELLRPGPRVMRSVESLRHCLSQSVLQEKP